jgi:hypothetical protein
VESLNTVAVTLFSVITTPAFATLVSIKPAIASTYNFISSPFFQRHHQPTSAALRQIVTSPPGKIY